MGKTKKRSKKTPVPLAPPAMRSRKKARITTTLFHKLTRERDEAQQRGDVKGVTEAEKAIEGIGGREAYQAASQLNTSIFSTSRWALGVIGQKGWLQGINVSADDQSSDAEVDAEDKEDARTCAKARKRKKVPKRNVRLLEVGAINRELLDAATNTRRKKNCSGGDGDATSSDVIVEERVYRLDVRAIDLRSSHPGIEEADFLKLPLIDDADPSKRYDAIVCSMVINCVTSPEDRGRMLALLYHQLRPEGLCMLTLPRLCLAQSRYTTPALFSSLLSGGVGFDILKTKESPKIQFYVLQRPQKDAERRQPLSPKWTQKQIINKARKFRNEFACVLNEDEVNGVF